MRVDRTTKRWCFCEADEYASRLTDSTGSPLMRFDESRVDHLFSCLSGSVVLWEGEYAGRPWTPLDWHWEVLGSIFGWIRRDEMFGRWVRRFRIASTWIGKKNAKTPTGALVGLYLLRFDGERGQQVWSAARDGRQAQPLHRNAINMIKNSPTLVDELKIRGDRITDESTLSFWDVLAGDNLKSQEGLNGSIIIDETHNVDTRLARIVADMGAGRSESLRAEFSTYGDDTSTYGRKQQEYGALVRSGKVKDPYFYYKAFAPDPETPDEHFREFRSNGTPTPRALSLWKQANPALGELLSVEEMTQAVTRASQTPADWNSFKARRLMVWTRSAETWLREKVWTAAERDVDIGECSGHGGGIGLDLARVNDMSAAVATVPDPQDPSKAFAFVRFWCSESRLDELARGHVPQILEWVRDGYVKATPGDVTDYNTIREDLIDLASVLDSQVLTYDPLFATELTLDVAEATGIGIVEFKQTLTSYSPVIHDTHRLLISGALTHAVNECWSWEAGHTLAKNCGDKLVRLVKDRHAPHKLIDGMQALVMSIAALQLTGWSSDDDSDDDDDDQPVRILQ